MDAVEQLLLGRIQELAAKLRQASLDYYNGEPTIPDDVYDAWRDELAELHADNPTLKDVGAPVAQESEWVKVRHQHTMGSLEKVNTPEEMSHWASRIQRDVGDLLAVTEKLDGISISLRYEGGKLVLAATRGDGTIGEDITANVRRMKGVPATVSVTDPLVVRGEIVLLKEDFEQHFKDKANTRNAASGTAKRTDGKGSEHLSVLTYQIVEGVDLPTEDSQFSRLGVLGFKTPRWVVVPTPEAVNLLWQEYEDSLREALPYEIDGLVVRLNDLPTQVSLGDTHGRPKGAVAFKFTPPARETVIREIVWQVGSIGRITPVAVFDPVTLVGAEVTRASLYNQAYIEQLGVDVGASVLVVRANDVIPRVTRVLKPTGTAKPPEVCPICSQATARDGEYIVCSNVATCPAQTAGRIKQWVGELNILEWGDTLIQKLVDAGLVKTVADLYRLTKEQLANLDRMGEKSAENALKTLWAASPMPLENFLGGLSIPLCATSTFRLVVDAGLDTVEKLHATPYARFLEIDGLGPKRASSLFDSLRTTHKALIQDILSTGVALKSRAVGNLTGKSVCFTGKSVRKRAELEALATNAGGAVKGSVGKGLTFLVLADPDSTSSKAVAARKNGTTCISEEAFVEMCGGPA